MEQVQSKYTSLCYIHSDINEHLPTLYRYATECESILELGWKKYKKVNIE